MNRERTLLLIEDEAANRAAVKRALRDSGLNFLEAEHGRQALDILADQPVDLILLDLAMPVMDGFTFLERFRAMAATQPVPVCVMTAWSDSSNRRRAIELGATDFVCKPVDNTELRARVHSLLRISTYRQRLDAFQAKLDKQASTSAGQDMAGTEVLQAQINQLQQARRQQEVWSEAQMWITEAQSSLSNSEDLSRFYQKIVHHAMVMTRAHHGTLALLDAAGEPGEVITPGAVNGEFPQLACLDDRQRILCSLLAQGNPLRVQAPDACPGCEFAPPNCPARSNLLLMPLRLDGQLHGALLLADKPGDEAFTVQDESLLQLFVIQVAGVLERKELLGALHRSNADLHTEQKEQRALIKRLQEAHEQLLQSEKMASLGQLAAGVAHEINNPVGFVNSNIGTLQKYVQQLLAVLEAYEQAESLLDGPALQNIRSARQQADIDFLKEDVLALVQESHQGLTRVKQIVQDLKDFSHVDEGEWQQVDLHQGLDSTLNIVNNELKYKAEIVREYGELPFTECIGSQLNQVFMNLLVNAAHAMEERGVITLRTGTEDNWVWVEISDTGKGIEPEHLKRIFDPFFTTKPVGSGTGLGLSLSYGIVEKHGGRIEVDSVLGQGTTFRVCLPVRQTETPMEAAG
ncbi:MAG TPA: response regulator [Gammaproteobacteria bacterium]|nr:response regulator [Gammaproteobacteria bacterium]